MLDFLKRIPEFGNELYDKTIGIMDSMPGVIKGILAVTILFFLVIGILTMLKKAFKVFGIILIAVAIVFIAGLILR